MLDAIRGSYRARLFTAMVLLVGAVVVSLGLYAQTVIKSRMRLDLDAQLERYARAAREILQARRPALSPVDFDHLADQAGDAIGVRVTFIDDEGRVLGDSAIDLPNLAALDDHRARPEIHGALQSGAGGSRRFSRTLDDTLEYRAIAFPYDALDGSNPTLVARVALPSSVADAPIDALTRAIWLAGAVALLLAAALAAWLTSLLSARFRSLAEQVRGVARLQDSPTLPLDGMASMAGSFGHLSATLERTVKTLARERDHFGAVLDSLGEAVISVDSNWRIESANAAARAMFGMEGESLGRAVIEFARVPVIGTWSDGPAERSYPQTEFKLGNGATARLVSAECFARQSGLGAVLVFRDITELRRLETVRTDFVANVSHELRTPISVISGAAETLELAGDDLSPPLQRFVEKIQRNSLRLGRLVGDLLDLSKLEARQGELESQAVDLRRCGRSVLASLGTRAEERKVELVNRIPEGLAAAADAGAVEQILTNLVENAIKYSGGQRVELWASRGPSGVSIGVDDQGPGVSDAHLSRLFERFYRVDPGRSRDMGGTGLGLAIVKHLCEAMGGHASATRLPERGMRFQILLPPVE